MTPREREREVLDTLANVTENVQPIHRVHITSFKCNEPTIADASNLVRMFNGNQLEFKRLKGNREIDIRRLPQFVNEFKKKNLTDCTPIVINGNGEILDHQHSYLCCLLAGLPAHFLIKMDGSIHDVITLNGNTKGWTNQNFIESGIERGNESFIKLGNIRKQYCMSYTQIKTLTGKCDFSFRKDIKTLNWQMTQVVNSTIIEIAEVFKKLRESLVGSNKKITNSASFINALCEIHACRYEQKDFITIMGHICNKLKGSYTNLEKQRNSDSYRRMLSDIYNKNKDKRKQIGLYKT